MLDLDDFGPFVPSGDAAIAEATCGGSLAASGNGLLLLRRRSLPATVGLASRPSKLSPLSEDESSPPRGGR